MTANDVPRPRTVRAASGSIVGYYEFGTPDGTPMVVLHGTPACGAGFSWADAAARERNIRLLALDRAGVGLSDPLPDAWCVRDFVPGLVGAIDALGLEQFAVIGYSGGGPYALALAHAAPERVHATGVVSGAGHVGVWASIDDFEAADARMTRLAMRAPRIAATALGALGRFARTTPALALRLTRAGMSAPDRAMLEATVRDAALSPAAALAVFTNAFLRGARGVVDDYAALGRPWGIDVEDVHGAVHCWHGTADDIVPLAHAEALVARLPGARLSTWPGEGHLAVVAHIGEVLERMLELAAARE